MTLHQETSLSDHTSLSDQSSHIDDTRPPDSPDPSLRSDEHHSLSGTPVASLSLTTSTPLKPFEETKDDDEGDSLPETEDDEEEENSVPDHHFDITTAGERVER